MVNTDFGRHLQARLEKVLRSRQLLKPRHPILVAVSGGQDSLCLMKLLLDLQAKWEWNLGIAHCDHRWPADVGNADRVREIANNWEIPFYLATASALTTSEGAARQWRYQTLREIAEINGYNYIMTGHTKSDRAETILYHLIRGSGIAGLSTLTWKRSLAPNLELVRPLLEITRAETAQFCQAEQLTIWEDATNQNLQYARNRIRLELLPYLKTNFNPQVEHNLAQTGELLRADLEYLEQMATDLCQKVISESDGSLKLNRMILKNAHLALQRRVMQQILQKILPAAPNYEHIEKLTALISAPNRSRTDPFPGGAIAQVNGEWIYILP